MTASTTEGIKTVLHPVSDLATAKAVYAALLGVSTDTLYRWIEARRITAADDDHGLMAVDGVALATLAQDLAESVDQTQRQDGRGPLGTKQIQRPGHPRGPRHRYGPGGDPGRAAQDCVAAQRRGHRRTRPGTRHARRRRRQGHQCVRRTSPQQIGKIVNITGRWRRRPARDLPMPVPRQMQRETTVAHSRSRRRPALTAPDTWRARNDLLSSGPRVRPLLGGATQPR